jgi:hypothetical protein
MEAWEQRAQRLTNFEDFWTFHALLVDASQSGIINPSGRAETLDGCLGYLGYSSRQCNDTIKTKERRILTLYCYFHYRFSGDQQFDSVRDILPEFPPGVPRTSGTKAQTLCKTRHSKATDSELGFEADQPPQQHRYFERGLDELSQLGIGGGGGNKGGEDPEKEKKKREKADTEARTRAARGEVERMYKEIMSGFEETVDGKELKVGLEEVLVKDLAVGKRRDVDGPGLVKAYRHILAQAPACPLNRSAWEKKLKEVTQGKSGEELADALPHLIADIFSSHSLTGSTPCLYLNPDVVLDPKEVKQIIDDLKEEEAKFSTPRLVQLIKKIEHFREEGLVWNVGITVQGTDVRQKTKGGNSFLIAIGLGANKIVRVETLEEAREYLAKLDGGAEDHENSNDEAEVERGEEEDEEVTEIQQAFELGSQDQVGGLAEDAFETGRLPPAAFNFLSRKGERGPSFASNRYPRNLLGVSQRIPAIALPDVDSHDSTANSAMEIIFTSWIQPRASFAIAGNRLCPSADSTTRALALKYGNLKAPVAIVNSVAASAKHTTGEQGYMWRTTMSSAYNESFLSPFQLGDFSVQLLAVLNRLETHSYFSLVSL